MTSPAGATAIATLAAVMLPRRHFLWYTASVTSSPDVVSPSARDSLRRRLNIR